METTMTATRRALLIAAALSFLAAPAFAETVRGNGVMKTETRPFSGFTGVGLGIPAKVEVKLGATEGITIEADENVLPLIDTRLKNGELTIKTVRDNLDLDTKSIRIVVQAKTMNQLDLGGSGSISAEQLKGAKIVMNIGGSGSIEVKNLDADHVEIAIGGSGNVKFGGTAKGVEASIGGSGNIVAPNFVADQAEITVAGSGDVTLGVRNKLEVTIAGAGVIGYYGDPKVSRTVLGSGVIKRLGPLLQ
jgi:hypothetical protein